MFEVHQDGSSCEHKCNIHVGVFDTDAAMGSASEQDIVLRVHVSRTFRVKPAFRVECVWFRVDGWVMQGVEERRDNHAADGYCIIIRDGERLGGSVGYLKHYEDTFDKESQRRRTMVTGGLSLILSLTTAWR